MPVIYPMQHHFWKFLAQLHMQILSFFHEDGSHISLQAPSFTDYSAKLCWVFLLFVLFSACSLLKIVAFFSAPTDITFLITKYPIRRRYFHLTK